MIAKFDTKCGVQCWVNALLGYDKYRAVRESCSFITKNCDRWANSLSKGKGNKSSKPSALRKLKKHFGPGRSSTGVPPTVAIFGEETGSPPHTKAKLTDKIILRC